MNKEIMKKLILAWSTAQKQEEVLPCPCCGGPLYTDLSKNALSRRADIYVCPDCGVKEGLEDVAACKEGMDPHSEDYPFDRMQDWYLFSGVKAPYVVVEEGVAATTAHLSDFLASVDMDELESIQQAFESELEIDMERVLRDYLTGNAEDMIVALTGWTMDALLQKLETNKE